MITFTLWHWLGFGALVTVLLALDLGVFHRKSHDTTIRQAAKSTLIWCALAMAFNVYVYWAAGMGKVGLEKASEFFTGYLVEWSLSIDNVFVFAVIFTYFKVPKKYQYRVLFWGIIGAVVLRLAFILVGTALLNHFHWVIYILGLFLIYTGIKLCAHDDEFDPESSLVVRVSRKLFRVSTEDHGQQFFAREAGKLCITPLFLVLLVIDFVDIAFALDSVPAILGITKDTFIVFTSNIFAILGLRALYFLLAGAMDMFRYLNYGLAAILVFVGVKMMSQEWIEDHLLGGDKIPHWVSLAVIVSLLSVAVGASLLAARREHKLPAHDEGDEGPDAERRASAETHGAHGNGDAHGNGAQRSAVSSHETPEISPGEAGA
ncbi:MAG TPA: TerC family protein [Pirellulales bacterium]|nr:TerC family protein [Pirellulales bacterium]